VRVVRLLWLALMGRQTITVAVLASTVALASGCGGNYCQSGSKYGTQCYDGQSGPQSHEPTGAYANEGSTSSPKPQRSTDATTPR
jgi:hypothetical protein